MGRCNFCRLRQIRSAAREKGLKVTVVHGECVEAFVHPVGVAGFQVKFFPEQYQQYKRAGFMALSDYCVCDD